MQLDLNTLGAISAILVLLSLAFNAVYPVVQQLFLVSRPKKLEHTQNPYTGLTFPQAVDALKNGSKIARRQWVGSGSFVALTLGRSIPLDEVWSNALKQHAVNTGAATIQIASYLVYLRPDDIVQVGWTPTSQDILATDWYILQ